MVVIKRFCFGTSAMVEVNQARKDLFSKKARNLGNIQRTRAVLEQYIMVQFSKEHRSGVKFPSACGWEKDKTSLKLKWMILPQAKDTCCELIHYSCCKCLKANFYCNSLCNCCELSTKRTFLQVVVSKAGIVMFQPWKLFLKTSLSDQKGSASVL